MGRAMAAQGLDDPYEYAHPYPGSTNNTLQLILPPKQEAAPAPTPTPPAPPAPAPAPAPASKLPWLAAAAVPLLLGAGAAGWFLHNQPASTAPVSPAAVVPVMPPADGSKMGMEYEVWERTGEGAWKKSTVTVDQLLGKGK